MKHAIVTHPGYLMRVEVKPFMLPNPSDFDLMLNDPPSKVQTFRQENLHNFLSFSQ